MIDILDGLINPVNTKALRGGHGFISINEDASGIAISNVVKVSFVKLYGNLLVRLYDSGIFEKFDINIEDDLILDVRNSLENKRNYTWLNSIWVNELLVQSDMIFDIFYQYTNALYGDIFKKVDWLYIDTDVFYINNEDDLASLNLDSYGLEYEVESIPFIFFERIKKYVKVNSKLELDVRGFSRYDTKRRDEIVNIMKVFIRDRRIDDILC